jgi:Asp-tRNA(Asn)/Glu-tRNA(Gln) amidotransferase A subunit family amidase
MVLGWEECHKFGAFLKGLSKGERTITMAELWRMSGLQLSRMIASRKVKPSEVMDAVLTRIEEVNPKINAFCTLAKDSAMAEARAADKKVTRATVPCGWTADGLPVGLQIVGRRFEDATVLRAAAAFEEARPWADRWPDR